MAESTSDDHIAAVYFAHACEINSISYEDLDIDRYRADLLFQSRFRDGYTAYYRHVQSLDRGFRVKPPLFSPEQEGMYRSYAQYKPMIDDLPHQRPSTAEMNQPGRFVYDRQRGCKNIQKRRRQHRATGAYISPSARLQNPRPPSWKRDHPNGLGFFASVHLFERWRQEQRQLDIQKQQQQQQQAVMRDGTCGAMVPYVGTSFVPTTNPFANDPFQKWSQ